MKNRQHPVSQISTPESSKEEGSTGGHYDSLLPNLASSRNHFELAKNDKS